MYHGFFYRTQYILQEKLISLDVDYGYISTKLFRIKVIIKRNSIHFYDKYKKIGNALYLAQHFFTLQHMSEGR